MNLRINKYLKSFLYVLIIILLLADVTFSFKQHMRFPMDGDMIPNVLCIDGVQQVISDPLALKVLLKDEKYINPNRYVSHLSHAWYMWNVPLLVQKLGAEPVESIYMAQAIFKISVQLLLILLIAAYTVVGIKKGWLYFLLAALIITPFFQSSGYNRQMGIIDQSTTYDFFYAWPMVFALLFFLPIAWSIARRDDVKKRTLLLLIPCGYLVAFSGPLNLGVASVGALVCFIIVANQYAIFSHGLRAAWNRIPKYMLLAITWVSLLCVYSIFINSRSGTMAEDIPPIAERYLLCIQGLANILTEEKAFYWLGALLVFNFVVSHFFLEIGYRKNIRRAYSIAITSCLLYLLLLPIGGYRPYREFVIRYDTFMPVTIALVWLSAHCCLLLLSQFSSKKYHLFVYTFGVVAVLFHFTQKDRLQDDANLCEREMLHYIQSSADYVVSLPRDCSVMEWNALTDYNKSVRHVTLLRRWHVLDVEKRFYYNQEKKGEESVN